MSPSHMFVSFFIFHTVVQSCVWWEPPGGKMYELECGMSEQLRCKFSAEYVTIKPGESKIDSSGNPLFQPEIDSGFGDAHFDTSDVDIKLKCSFKIERHWSEIHSIVIISAKDGNITHARIEYNKGKRNGSSWEVVKHKEGNGNIETSEVIIASKQKAGTVYTCLCPKQNHDFEEKSSYLKYSLLNLGKPENEYLESPSQYTVPVYSPCKQKTCSDMENEHMQHCYEMNNKTNLNDLSSEDVRNMVKSCTELNSVSNDWVQEKWESPIENVIRERNLALVQKLRLITSKYVARHVCTLMSSLSDWWNISEDKSAMFDKHLEALVEIMYNIHAPFAWKNPNAEEVGALFLLHGYNKRPNNKTSLTRGKDHIRCTQHIEMLEDMKMKLGSNKGLKDRNFYAKTYPTCVGDFEEEFEKDSIALSFNRVPAFYNSKHVSFNQDKSDNLLILRAPNNNSAVLNTNKIYREQKIDCSLYKWKKSKGMENYTRIKLEFESPENETNATSQVITFHISKTFLKDHELGYKYLVGCYIKYNYDCEGKPCDKTSMHKKMQLYIEVKKDVRYFDVVNDGHHDCISLDRTKDSEWHIEKDPSGFCECVYNISLCNPLKTTSSLRRNIPCPPKSPKSPAGKDKPAKPHSTFMIVLFAIAAVILIVGSTMMFVFKPYKSKSPKTVLMILPSNEPPETINNADFFDSGSITEAPKSEGNAASILTPIDGSKADVSSQK